MLYTKPVKNHFDDYEFYKHFKKIVTNRNHDKIDISGLNISTYIRILVKELRLETHIRFLNIDNCIISHKGINKLLQAIQKNTTLEKFKFSGIKMTNKNVYELIQVINKNEFIKKLDISGSVINNLMIGPLTQAIMTNTTITSLNVSDMKLGESGINKFFEAIAWNTGLKKFIIRNNNSDKKCSILTLKLINFNKTLEILDMSMNNLDVCLVTMILNFDIYETLSQLKKINMSHNNIRCRLYCSLILQYINKTPLRELDLSYNNLDGKCIPTIIKYLSRDGPLQKIILSGITNVTQEQLEMYQHFLATTNKEIICDEIDNTLMQQKCNTHMTKSAKKIIK